MTADDFRRLALSFPGAVESAHMNHPDFRVGKRIFATLGYPDDGWGMVKLTPEEQQNFLDAAPEVFSPVPGGWGRGGATRVCLKLAKKPLTRKALETAWQAQQPRNKNGKK
jgi:hypothetical protein